MSGCVVAKKLRHSTLTTPSIVALHACIPPFPQGAGVGLAGTHVGQSRQPQSTQPTSASWVTTQSWVTVAVTEVGAGSGGRVMVSSGLQLMMTAGQATGGHLGLSGSTHTAGQKAWRYDVVVLYSGHSGSSAGARGAGVTTGAGLARALQ